MDNNLSNKIEKSVELLRKMEKTALKYDSKGFYMAFSGGKDSQALYHIAKLAGVKFEAHYNLTTIDPPEVVRFIKNQYPDVIIDRPEITFAKLCIKKKALPLRQMRFCCKYLKEIYGAGRIVITGIRKEESQQRNNREEIEEITKKRNGFKGDYEQFDQFTRTKEIENVECIKGKDKIIVNPIIYWRTKDVWDFLNDIMKVEHCSIYDKGFHRLGCIFCPMKSKQEKAKEQREYQKYKELIIRTINKLRKGGYLSDYQKLTDEQIFFWWISNQGLDTWYNLEIHPQLHF